MRKQEIFMTNFTSIFKKTTKNHVLWGKGLEYEDGRKEGRLITNWSTFSEQSEEKDLGEEALCDINTLTTRTHFWPEAFGCPFPPRHLKKQKSAFFGSFFLLPYRIWRAVFL